MIFEPLPCCAETCACCASNMAWKLTSVSRIGGKPARVHTSETIGGLLNATFGNVTELIVSLVALFGGMLRIVQVSLLGSILSNLLLVLGCAFLVGGLKYPEQKYSHKAQTLSFGLLLLAVLCIAMPTVLEITHDVEYPEHSSLDVSRSMSLMMIVTYYLYLVFRKRPRRERPSNAHRL